MYVVVFFFISGNFYFLFCFNFIRIHYQTQNQKKKIIWGPPQTRNLVVNNSFTYFLGNKML